MADQSSIGYIPVNKAGDTMTGLLVLSGDPATALGAATKQYVDATATGLDVKTPVVAASTGALTVTYSNGVAGVGATLTNAGAMAAFALDGVSPSVAQRVLIKNQVSTFQNGIYTVTVVGNGGVNWILTRATDYDKAPEEIYPGNLVIVTSGTTNGTTSWIETATVATIGTDPITFSAFTTAPLTLPLAVTQGGTGVATLTTAYGTLAAGTTATGNVQTVAPGTTGQALVSAGAAALPAYGTLPVTGGGTGLATATTAYAPIVAGTTATGAFQVASTGLATSGFVLTSNGNAAVPSFQAAAGASGGFTRLATATASASATLDFAGNLSATYDNYLLVFENFSSSAADFFQILIGTGAGPTYAVTNYSGEGAGNTTASTWTVSAWSATSAADITHLTTANSATRITGGYIYVQNCNNASNDKTITGQLTSWGFSATIDQINVVCGRWQGATVLTSLRVLAKTGNLTTGTVKLYGITN